VASFTLDRETSAAGHARPGFWAGGDGLCCTAKSSALHAAVDVRVDVRTIGAARHAMPSRDGTVETAAVSVISPRIRNLVSSHQRRQLLSEPLLLWRD